MPTRSTKGESVEATPRQGTATDEFPGTEAPSRITPQEVETIVEAPAVHEGPKLDPPSMRTVDSATEASLETVTGTWRNSQYVDATWAINQTRNAFMLVRGLGWKKIYNGRDGAFTALTFLAAQARQTGRTVNFREEADGMVYEIYFW